MHYSNWGQGPDLGASQQATGMAMGYRKWTVTSTSYHCRPKSNQEATLYHATTAICQAWSKVGSMTQRNWYTTQEHPTIGNEHNNACGIQTLLSSTKEGQNPVTGSQLTAST